MAGCFGEGNGGQDDGSGLDLNKIGDDAARAAAAKGAGGFSLLGNMYAGLFRSRRFLDSSLQSHTEAPDPLFAPVKSGTSFAIRSRRGNTGGY